ncbi:MAG TPA: hypothetical protein VFT35_11855 [Gaiellaceae bacterium]|jgi:hypothetical protein|nr:hypothetical protein [Gaiellaceae bacterium]
MPSRGAVLATVVLAALVIASGQGAAAPATPPSNAAEPAISGRAEQGVRLSASRGTWTGTSPISYAYQWVRCGADGGQPDGGSCSIISGATTDRYRLTSSDVGSRMRVRVTATNVDGSRTATSNPTSVVVGPPVNTSPPAVRGSLVNGQVVTADPGSWSGAGSISFTYRWLRCNSQGGECASIGGATSRSYRLTSADVGHKMRFNVAARNSVGTTTALSGESAIVTEPLPSGAIRLPSGEISIPATSVPSNQRLIVSVVQFSPSRVTSRTAPITVRVRVKETRGYVVRDALVFVRSTPRVTAGGDRQAATTDGWVTYQLAPNGNFPKPRNGFNVQFFVKAYRSGDPALAGIAAYRLVQVPLAK